MPRVLGFGKRLAGQVAEDEVMDVAAGLAYRFLFAIFPFAIFLAALAAFVSNWIGIGDPTDELLAAMSDNLPADVAQQLRPQLEVVLGDTRPALLSFGAIAALWAATGGVGAVIKAMNRAYDVEESRGFLARTGVALGLTLLASLGILVAFVTIVGGSVLTEQAVETLGIGAPAWTAISLLRFPVVLLLVGLAVAILFRWGPNVSVSFRWTIVGGILFAVAWVLATVAFGVYVANFANYANTYGALGGVVVLMLWFYLTAVMLLIAAEVTSLLAKEREPGRIAARQDEVRASAARKVGTAGAAVASARQAMEGAANGRQPGAGQRDDRQASGAPPRPGGIGDGRPALPAAAHPGAAHPGAAHPGAPGRGLRVPRGSSPLRGEPGAGGRSGWARRVPGLVVVAVGAALGALVGLVTGLDEDEAARA